MWADKNLESVKSQYQKELEGYKHELDLIKQKSERYSSKQFELYQEFWSSLCDLENFAESLWSQAVKENLIAFIIQLKKTKDKVKRGFLFVPDADYRELQRLLDKCSSYQMGKLELIYYTFTDSPSPFEIQQMTDRNSEFRRDYIRIIQKIGVNLKKQIVSQ